MDCSVVQLGKSAGWDIAQVRPLSSRPAWVLPEGSSHWAASKSECNTLDFNEQEGSAAGC